MSIYIHLIAGFDIKEFFHIVKVGLYVFIIITVFTYNDFSYQNGQMREFWSILL